VTVRENEIRIETAGFPLPDLYIGLYADQSSDVVFANNVVENVFYGAIVDDVDVRAWILDNRFTGVVYSSAIFSASFGVIGVRLGSDMAGDHRVERNILRHFTTGIEAAAGGRGGTVVANRILRSAGPSTGPLPTTPVELRNYLDSKSYAIELSGGRCIADRNHIELDSAEWGGIRVRTERATVTANVIVGNLPEGQLLVPPAIYCTIDTTNGRVGNFATLSDNVLQGAQTGIVASRVAGVAICDNRVDGLFRGWFGVRLDDCSATTVADNHVASVSFGFALSDGDHNLLRSCRFAFALAGVTADAETDLTIRDSEFIGGAFGAFLLSIQGGDTLISGNRIANCGWVALGPIQGAIFVISGPLFEPVTNSLRIDSCEILEAGVAPDGTTATGAVRGIHAWVPNCQILGNRVVSTNPKLLGTTDEHRALLLLGPLSYSGIPIMVGSAIVANNVFRGPGATCLVQFFRFDLIDALKFWFHKIAFNGNFCDHNTTEGDNKATVLLIGLHALATGNQITSLQGVASIDIRTDSAASVVGNITSGAIRDTGVTLQATPLTNFNMTV
jgi:hypothetical protein